MSSGTSSSSSPITPSTPTLAGPATTTFTTADFIPTFATHRPTRDELADALRHAQTRAYTRHLRQSIGLGITFGPVTTTSPTTTTTSATRTPRPLPTPPTTFARTTIPTFPAASPIGKPFPSLLPAASPHYHTPTPTGTAAPAPFREYVPSTPVARPAFPHRRSRVAPIHPLRRRLHWRVRVFYEDAVLSPAHVPPARRTPGARGAPASEKGEEGEEDAKTQEGESYFHLPLDLFSTNAPTRPQEEREERKEAKVGLGLLGVDFWEDDEDVIEKESS